jgi:Uma2 family endonuclease
MIATGILGPSDHVELLDGEIVHMTPKGPAHATAVGLVRQALQARLPASCHIRTEQPFALEDRTMPEPDVTVVQGGPRDYRDTHPTTAWLIVEIADSGLARDREHKLGLYARAQVGAYWIVNIAERRLEVYQHPASSAASPTGWSYQHRTLLRPDEEVVAFPGAPPVAVTDLLP